MKFFSGPPDIRKVFNCQITKSFFKQDASGPKGLFALPFLNWFGIDPEFNHWEIQWSLPEYAWIGPLVAVLVLVSVWFFWTSLSRIGSLNKRLVLMTIRAMALMLMLALLLHPQLELKKSRELKNSVAVLLDNSKSLSIKSAETGGTRISQVQKALQENTAFFEQVKEKFQLDTYFVSDHVQSVELQEGNPSYKAEAERTNFTKVLREVQKRYEGKSLKGVLLFSDGADLGQPDEGISVELLETLTHFEVPIHTFQAGSNEGFKDLGIESLQKGDFGFVHQPVRIKVSLIAHAMGSKQISLILKEGDTVLVSKILKISPDKTRYPVELEFTPHKTGKRLYSLSVPLFAGEAIDVNNSKDFQINVIRDRIRVLHLSGRPSWDSRFLREVLIKNPKVDLLSFFILRTLSDDVAAPTAELSLIPFPSNLLFSEYLSSFDLVIFQNFQFAPFIDKKYLLNIKEFVQNGGAFIMVGGELSFQGGGYKNTPVEDLLPVRFESASKSLLEDEFHPALNKRYKYHPILQLEKDSKTNKSAWTTLPPLNGMNLGLIPESNAHVLATFPKQGEPTLYPLLVAGQKGIGRTLLVATDTLWNWNFRSVGKGGSGRYFQKLWKNIIAWVTRDPETHFIQIETDKEKYRVDDKPLVKYRIRREDYNPDPQKALKLVLASLTSKRILQTHKLVTDDRGEGSFRFRSLPEGFYTIRLEDQEPDSKLLREIGFGVFSDHFEFQKPLVNGSLLKKMASKTGGTYHLLGDNVNLDSIKIPNEAVFFESKSKTFALWDNWWSFGMIVFLLSADWWLRRRAGLS